MNLHISLLSVSTLAAAVMAATAAMAQPLSPAMMGGPVAPPSPQESASLLARRPRSTRRARRRAR